MLRAKEEYEYSRDLARDLDSERERDHQSVDSVQADFCSLSGQVRSFLSNMGEPTAADCFCPDATFPFETYSPRVMDFIWEAVREKINDEYSAHFGNVNQTLTLSRAMSKPK